MRWKCSFERFQLSVTIYAAACYADELAELTNASQIVIYAEHFVRSSVKSLYWWFQHLWFQSN